MWFPVLTKLFADNILLESKFAASLIKNVFIVVAPRELIDICFVLVSLSLTHTHTHTHTHIQASLPVTTCPAHQGLDANTALLTHTVLCRSSASLIVEELFFSTDSDQKLSLALNCLYFNTSAMSLTSAKHWYSPPHQMWSQWSRAVSGNHWMRKGRWQS